MNTRPTEIHDPKPVAAPSPETPTVSLPFRSHIDLRKPPTVSGVVHESSTHAPPPPELPGYVILGELGRGGMGVVYKAHQVALKRFVAIKMILSGPQASLDSVLRFEAEAEAVARLRHPNIVQIYDMGRSADRPYLVMEYIDGISLGRWLDGRPQQPRDAAGLLVTLAEAMDHAHQHGIVHRDLKPENVLLAEPRETLTAMTPKITDFGLAKLLDATETLTATGEVIGTPAYMAPEQTLPTGQEVTPAVDVYALGVLLYELLTGRTPFLGPTIFDTALMIRTVEPAPPRALQPNVPRDLETICLKCLDKEPGRRYASAPALADDLKRFLRHRPIHARPTPWTVRTARWCRRRPAVAALLAVLILTGVGAFAGMHWLYLQTQMERDDARSQHAQADAERRRANANLALADRAFEDFNSIVSEDRQLRSREMQHLRQQLLQITLPLYEQLAGQNGDDVRMLTAKAKALAQLGVLHAQLEKYPQAITELTQSRDLFASLSTAQPDNDDLQVGIAKAADSLGLAYAMSKKSTEAEAAYQQAVGIFERLVREHRDVADYRDRLARTYAHLGRAYRIANRLPDAEAIYLKAHQLREQLAQQFPGDGTRQRALAESFNGLGSYYATASKWSQADEAFRHALTLWQDIAGKEPIQPQDQSTLVGLYCNLGNLNNDRGDPSALDWYAKAIALAEAEQRRDNPDPSLRRGLRNALVGEALAWANSHRHAEAVKSWDRALALKDGPEQNWEHAHRCWSLVLTGDAKTALAEADALSSAADATADGLPIWACAYAAAAAANQGDVAEEHARRAIELLRRAVTLGYDNLAVLKKEKGFDSLRQRPEFQHLLAELEKKRNGP